MSHKRLAFCAVEEDAFNPIPVAAPVIMSSSASAASAAIMPSEAIDAAMMELDAMAAIEEDGDLFAKMARSSPSSPLFDDADDADDLFGMPPLLHTDLDYSSLPLPHRWETPERIGAKQIEIDMVCGPTWPTVEALARLPASEASQYTLSPHVMSAIRTGRTLNPQAFPSVTCEGLAMGQVIMYLMTRKVNADAWTAAFINIELALNKLTKIQESVSSSNPRVGGLFPWPDAMADRMAVPIKPHWTIMAFSPLEVKFEPVVVSYNPEVLVKLHHGKMCMTMFESQLRMGQCHDNIEYRPVFCPVVWLLMLCREKWGGDAVEGVSVTDKGRTKRHRCGEVDAGIEIIGDWASATIADLYKSDDKLVPQEVSADIMCTVTECGPTTSPQSPSVAQTLVVKVYNSMLYGMSCAAIMGVWSEGCYRAIVQVCNVLSGKLTSAGGGLMDKSDPLVTHAVVTILKALIRSVPNWDVIFNEPCDETPCDARVKIVVQLLDVIDLTALENYPRMTITLGASFISCASRCLDLQIPSPVRQIINVDAVRKPETHVALLDYLNSRAPYCSASRLGETLCRWFSPVAVDEAVFGKMLMSFKLLIRLYNDIVAKSKRVAAAQPAVGTGRTRRVVMSSVATENDAPMFAAKLHMGLKTIECATPKDTFLVQSSVNQCEMVAPVLSFDGSVPRCPMDTVSFVYWMGNSNPDVKLVALHAISEYVVCHPLAVCTVMFMAPLVHDRTKNADMVRSMLQTVKGGFVSLL